MNQNFFLRTFFHSALAILGPQVYLVLEQFGVENISLLSGHLVLIENIWSGLNIRFKYSVFGFLWSIF